MLGAIWHMAVMLFRLAQNAFIGLHGILFWFSILVFYPGILETAEIACKVLGVRGASWHMAVVLLVDWQGIRFRLAETVWVIPELAELVGRLIGLHCYCVVDSLVCIVIVWLTGRVADVFFGTC